MSEIWFVELVDPDGSNRGCQKCCSYNEASNEAGKWVRGDRRRSARLLRGSSWSDRKLVETVG